MYAANLIKIKRAQNLERRNRETFIANLDGELCHLLKDAEFIYGNEVPRAFQNTYDEIQSGSSGFDLSIKELDDINHLISVLPENPKVKGSSFLSIGYDYPVFRINFTEAYSFLPELISKVKEFNRFFIINEADSRQGIIISEYVGYLPKEFQTNNREVVYTLTYWGFK